MTKDLEFLLRICKQAGELVTDDFAVKSKGGGTDLVTSFDYEIEQFIINQIKKEYPNFGIISEEFNPKAKLTANCFTVDPLDGTVNFAHGLASVGDSGCVRQERRNCRGGFTHAKTE